MQGNGGSSSSYLYNNGESSSNSSASEPSSTKGVITSTPLPQQIPFIPQSQMGQPVYFPNHNSFGSSVGFVGNMDHPLDNSRQHQPPSQQRFYNGG